MNDGRLYNVIGNLRLVDASHMQSVTENAIFESLLFSVWDRGEGGMGKNARMGKIGVRVKLASKLSAPYISSWDLREVLKNQNILDHFSLFGLP